MHLQSNHLGMEHLTFATQSASAINFVLPGTDARSWAVTASALVRINSTSVSLRIRDADGTSVLAVTTASGGDQLVTLVLAGRVTPGVYTAQVEGTVTSTSNITVLAAGNPKAVSPCIGTDQLALTQAGQNGADLTFPLSGIVAPQWALQITGISAVGSASTASITADDADSVTRLSGTFAVQLGTFTAVAAGLVPPSSLYTVTVTGTIQSISAIAVAAFKRPAVPPLCFDPTVTPLALASQHAATTPYTFTLPSGSAFSWAVELTGAASYVTDAASTTTLTVTKDGSTVLTATTDSVTIARNQNVTVPVAGVLAPGTYTATLTSASGATLGNITLLAVANFL
jgi:hypothetical protein